MTSGRLCKLLLVGALLGACSRANKQPNGVVPPAATPAVPRQISGVLLDAATGALVTGATQVTVLGANGLPSPYALDAAGVTMNAFTVSTGVVSFQVDRNAPLPVDFVVVSRAPGYTAGSARVEVDGNGTFTFTTRLARLSAPPAGVFASAVPAAATADLTGAIGGAIDVTTPAADATVPTVELQVPAGTVLTTAGGTPLTGALAVSATYFSASSDAALAAFPGSLDVAVDDGAGGVSTGTFQTAGFVAVQITDSAGNVAASFGQPFSLTVDVPVGTLAPDGTPLVLGDAIPFWSYDETIGEWVLEGDVTLTSEANGLFTGVATADHGSYFNLGWFTESCTAAQPITLTGYSGGVALTLTLRSPTGGYFRELRVTSSPVVLADPPAVPLDVEATLDGEMVGSIAAADVCGADPLAMDVTLPFVLAATLQVDVIKACQEDPTLRAAAGSATVVVQPAGLIGTTRSNGRAMFYGLVSGAPVSVSARLLDGSSIPAQQVTLVPGSNPIQLVQSVDCVLTGLTGGSGL